MLHKNVGLNGNHIIHNWEYADAAARLAATGFVPGDVYKLALQLDTKQYWLLVDDSPATWQDLLAFASNGIAPGGATREYLRKVSGTDYDTEWAPSDVPTGGTTGQVLSKTSGADFATAWVSIPYLIPIAISDEITAITAGVSKVTFRMPRAMALTAVRASLTVAQAAGSILTIDINEGGTSILSTKLTIDNTEKTSTTAVTAPVISDAAIADDAEITIDIDQVGDGSAKGLKVYLIGT